MISLFSPTLNGGGAERVLVNLAHGLVSRNVSVDVVLIKREGMYLSQLPPQVRIYDLGGSRCLTAIAPLAQYLREHRPASMLAFQDHASVVAVWAKLLSRTSTRIVASVHSSWSKVMEKTPATKTVVLKRLARWTYSGTHGVVAVSSGVADDLAEIVGFPRQAITVIYNPVVTDAMFEKAAQPLRHPWFLPDAPPVILAVGRLVAEKDFETLVRAFARVRSRKVCRLLILGEGPERASLERLITTLGLQQDALLFGATDNPYPFMKAARVFVLSSRHEGLPTVLIEAMSLGAPCIATDCRSGPSEILARGQHGLLTPVGDVDALSAAIMDSLDSPVRTVPATAWQRFTLSAALDAYERVLRGAPPNLRASR